MMRAFYKAVIGAGMITAAIAGLPAAAEGQFHVLELVYATKSGAQVKLHFAADGTFSRRACEKVVDAAIREYGPNLRKAFKTNFGSDMSQWAGLTFVGGHCQGFAIPPGQLMNLRLSGQ